MIVSEGDFAKDISSLSYLWYLILNNKTYIDVKLQKYREVNSTEQSDVIMQNVGCRYNITCQ